MSNARSGESRRRICGLRGFRSSLGVSCILLATHAAMLQASVTGSISGTVTDATGAVVPIASVVALEDETGIKHNTHTDAQGFYSFPILPVGHYSVAIQASGFREYHQTGLVIDVNSALRVDVSLELGTVSQQVNVSATVVHVETTNTQMGEVITGTKMTDLPLNGRAYTDLLGLQPGVVPISSGLYASPQVSGNLNPGNLSISGQREEANGFMVNGGSVEEGKFNGTAIIPNIDSIAEFRILTNNFDAEYGNYSGGLVNVLTKSGTNQFHGDLFEFLRNSNMDSRNFYSAGRGTLHQNQFGATIGGPVRRDKVFFFGDYQGTRQVAGVDTGLVPVPSVQDRQGNLSDVASKLKGRVGGTYFANLLSQSLGYPVASGEAYYSSSCASTAQCVFPGAAIPAAAWSAPASKIMPFIPIPNVGTGFFSTAAYDQTLRDDKWSARADGNSRLGLLSAYYFMDSDNLLNPYPSGKVPGFAAASHNRAQLLNLGLTRSFGGSKVNELHLNYMRNFVGGAFPVASAGPSLSSLGFATGPASLGIVPLDPALEGVPHIAFNSFTTGTVNGVTNLYYNTYQVLDNFAKVSGTHSIKLGGDFEAKQINLSEFGEPNGQFAFSGTQTGLDFADFLLGAPTTYQQGAQLPMYSRGRYYGLYIQDSWRARPALTLNYGFRWEVSTPWWEKHNALETLIPGRQSVVFPTAPAGLLVPGDPGIPRTVSPIRYANFGPRIGLAYSPRGITGRAQKLFGGPGNTSIRAGWGMFHTSFGDNYNLSNVQGDAPFGFFWSSPTPPLFATPFVDLNTGNSEGQRFPVTFPPLNVSASNPDPNVNWAHYEPITNSPGFSAGNTLAVIEQYNLSVQRQFGTGTILSLSYVGTQAHHLLASLGANPGNPALCLSVSQTNEVVAGTPTCGAFGENGVYHPAGGGVINGTRAPLGPSFGSDVTFNTLANSNFNAFETSLRHVSGRLEWLVAYTYSKSMDNASSYGQGGLTINPINAKLSKGLSSFDMTHNFVASYNYELPFDKLLRGNRATRGWNIGGIARFTTGLPVFITDANDHSFLGMDTGGVGQSVDTPNFTPGAMNYTNPRTRLPYFNTSLFTQGGLGQLGTASQRFFHGPGINNWDLTLTKSLRLTESKSLQFRGEYFDAFNHAEFNNPTSNFLSSAFGLVTAARYSRVGQVAMKFYF